MLIWREKLHLLEVSESFVKMVQRKYLELYVKAVNQQQKELILSLGYDTSNWIFETVGWGL